MTAIAVTTLLVVGHVRRVAPREPLGLGERAAARRGDVCLRHQRREHRPGPARPTARRAPGSCRPRRARPPGVSCTPTGTPCESSIAPRRGDSAPAGGSEAARHQQRQDERQEPERDGGRDQRGEASRAHLAEPVGELEDRCGGADEERHADAHGHPDLAADGGVVVADATSDRPDRAAHQEAGQAGQERVDGDHVDRALDAARARARARDRGSR